MDSKGHGFGVIYDKGGSHYLDKERQRPLSTGYRMGHHPGKTKNCFICKTQKPNVGHATNAGRFICMDCKEKFFKPKGLANA